MKTNTRSLSPSLPKALFLTATVGLVLTSVSSQAQTLVGDYTFDNTLASSVAGAPALTVTDPQNASGFGTATVFGATHSVYNYVGGTDPAQQAGLTLNTTGLLPTPNSYSVQMVVSVNNIQGDGTGWVRLLDVQNRASDNGFYYDPSHVLDVFPVTGSGATVAANTFEDVVLTVAPGTGGAASTVKAYLNNVLSFSTTTSLMDVNFDPTDNPDGLMNFFLDNTAGSGQGEFSSGSIAEIKLYDGALSDDQVADLDANPLTPPTDDGVPDATSTLSLLTLATTALFGAARKFRQ